MSDATDDRMVRLEARISARLDQLAASLAPRGSVERFIDIAVKVMLVLAPAAGAVIYGQGNRITALEQSTVTNRDFQMQMATVNEKFAAASQGPQWLRDSLAGVNAKLDVMRDSVSALTERVVRVESHTEKK